MNPYSCNKTKVEVYFRRIDCWIAGIVLQTSCSIRWKHFYTNGSWTTLMRVVAFALEMFQFTQSFHSLSMTHGSLITVQDHSS